MLTNEDLSKIDQLIQKRIEEGNKPIKKALNSLQKDVSTMLNVLDRADVALHKRIKNIEERLNI